MTHYLLWGNSLLCKEKTGNFGDSTHNPGHRACRKLSLYAWISEFPAESEQGIFCSRQGTYASEHGFKTSNQGKRVFWSKSSRPRASFYAFHLAGERSVWSVSADQREPVATRATSEAYRHSHVSFPCAQPVILRASDIVPSGERKAM